MPGDHLPPQFNRSPGPSLFSLEGGSCRAVVRRLAPSSRRGVQPVRCLLRPCLNASLLPFRSVVRAGETPHLVGSPWEHHGAAFAHRARGDPHPQPWRRRRGRLEPSQGKRPARPETWLCAEPGRKL